MTHQLSPDFVPTEKRRRGLTIQVYRINAQGERYADTGAISVDPEDIAAVDLHPSQTWPACRCPHPEFHSKR